MGYEINFKRSFHECRPPRPLGEIEVDIQKVDKEMLATLREVVGGGEDTQDVGPWRRCAAISWLPRSHRADLRLVARGVIERVARGRGCVIASRQRDAAQQRREQAGA